MSHSKNIWFEKIMLCYLDKQLAFSRQLLHNHKLHVSSICYMLCFFLLLYESQIDLYAK